MDVSKKSIWNLHSTMKFEIKIQVSIFRKYSSSNFSLLHNPGITLTLYIVYGLDALCTKIRVATPEYF